MPAHLTRQCGVCGLTDTRQRRREEGDGGSFNGMASGEGGADDMRRREVTSPMATGDEEGKAAQKKKHR
jgi:hypothetical protein